MHARTTRIDTPPPGTPAYRAYLAARQAALGLVVDIPLEMPPAEPNPPAVSILEEPLPIEEPEAPEIPPEPEPGPREPYDWTWRGPVASIWPACHPNHAHRYAYVWLSDEQRYHCLCCVSLREQRRREERRYAELVPLP